MAGESAKRYPELATLGFWLRRASLLSMKKRFLDRGATKIGRGLVFHIAPSNVPVNYAYSLFTGLICGNANIVRLPSKDFPQVGLINGAIRKALGEERHALLRPCIHLVRYGRDKRANDYFSFISDVRVIWGGNRTIAELRQSPMPPRATEILFADRYSLAVMDSDAYMASENKPRIIAGFYNDTYFSDQNACTSPRAVVWTGSRIREAKREFWAGLESFAESRYPFQAVQGVDKLSLFCVAATRHGGLKAVAGGRNILWRIQTSRLSPWLMNDRGNSGYFYEYDCGDILELREFCNDTRCQTISYIGDRGMLKPLLESGLKGIDRVVPVGHTMDFDIIWDGYNLVEGLTRTLGCK